MECARALRTTSASDLILSFVRLAHSSSLTLRTSAPQSDYSYHCIAHNEGQRTVFCGEECAFMIAHIIHTIHKFFVMQVVFQRILIFASLYLVILISNTNAERQ